ncbi:MAG: hypothetical protein FH762_09500 [Firmicutes bacterium]|nr:hypothetical protein [Bacillota bacterium]
MGNDLDFLFKVQDDNKDDFEKNITTFICHRFEDDSISKYSKEYKENSYKYNDLFHQIRQGLSKEKNSLLHELDLCIGEIEGITEKVRYMQGLKDGFKFFNMLNT